MYDADGQPVVKKEKRRVRRPSEILVVQTVWKRVISDKMGNRCSSAKHFDGVSTVSIASYRMDRNGRMTIPQDGVYDRNS